MAIEDFGRSLLSQVHEQRRRQRKKRESYEKKAALASIVVPVGVRAIENVIQSKAADFLASEEMMARNRQVGNAVEVGNMYEEQERKIQASNLPGIQYFVSDLTPRWEAIASTHPDFPTEFQGKGIYNAVITPQVLELATREYEKHKIGYALSQKMGSIEDYHTMSALNTKDVRPTNFVDLIGRQISTLFGGKSTQEREQEAIVAIENSNIFTTAESLNTLKETYARTNSLPAAYSYAQFMLDIGNVDKSKLEPAPTQSLEIIGTRVFLQEEVIRWNEDAEVWEKSFVRDADGKIKLTEIQDLTDPNDRLRANRAGFNFGTQPRLHLSEAGRIAWRNDIKKYNKEHEGEEGYKPLNPNLYEEGEKGLKQYEQLAGIFFDVMSKPENMKTDADTFLLLSQLFSQIIDPYTVDTLVDAVGQAREDLLVSKNIEDTRYGQASSSLDPDTIGSGQEKMAPMTAANIEFFEERLQAEEDALYNYYREVASKSQEISEGLINSGGLTSSGTPPPNWQDVLTPGDPDTSTSVSDISDPTDYRTYFQQIKQQYEDDEITQEDWEYFQENGELPPKP